MVAGNQNSYRGRKGASSPGGLAREGIGLWLVGASSGTSPRLLAGLTGVVLVRPSAAKAGLIL